MEKNTGSGWNPDPIESRFGRRAFDALFLLCCANFQPSLPNISPAASGVNIDVGIARVESGSAGTDIHVVWSWNRHDAAYLIHCGSRRDWSERRIAVSSCTGRDA